MADDKDGPERSGNKGVARRAPGAATLRFAGYRVDELTEALACYEEAFVLYARELVDALDVWLAGKRLETEERLKDDEQLKADELAFHRQEAYRRAVIAAVALGKRLGLTVETHALADLACSLETIQFDGRTPDCFKARRRNRPAATPHEDRLARAAAVGAYVVLREKGVTRKNAATKVAGRMANRGYRLPGRDRHKPTDVTVLGWFERREERLAGYERQWSGDSLRDLQRLKGAPLTEDEVLGTVDIGLLLG